ncbi:MAG: hypothetical protein M1831_001286 [Alyxoria varia]|nr:MAG: hypothetical protein M1831_001286 [Alyxoria varia]
MALESDWVHDRFDDDSSARRRPDPRARFVDRYTSDREHERTEQPSSTKLRVENLHYDLTESNLRELFTRIGPIAKLQLIYDRADRSTGVAFVSYTEPRDAEDAVREFDGANAYGQPIHLSIVPTGPTGRGVDSRVNKPGRSLFDRIDDGAVRDRRRRSESPQARKPRDILDRYVPPARRRSLSPAPRRAVGGGGGGGGGNGGRRPGQRRDDSRRGTGGRGGGRRRGGGRPTRDEEGHPLVGGRPRKTADELDEEMKDYWNVEDAVGQAGDAAPADNIMPAEIGQADQMNGADQPAGGFQFDGTGDGDIDMIE